MSIYSFKVIARRASRSKVFTSINALGLMLRHYRLPVHCPVRLLPNTALKISTSTSATTYRVNLYNTQNGVFDEISSGTVSGLGYAMQQTLPGIRLWRASAKKPKALQPTRSGMVKPAKTRLPMQTPPLGEMLALQIIDGNARQLLHSPQTVVHFRIGCAKVLRHHLPPQGKRAELGFSNNSVSRQPYAVSGVFRDIPANSHLHIDFLLPVSNLQSWNENWNWSDVATYVRLTPQPHPKPSKPDWLPPSLTNTTRIKPATATCWNPGRRYASMRWTAAAAAP